MNMISGMKKDERGKTGIRTVIIFVLMLAMMALLAGCDKDQGRGSENDPSKETAEEVLGSEEHDNEENSSDRGFDMMAEGTPKNGFFTVARVEEVLDDGSLTLVRYMRTADSHGYSISNYANVNFQYYAPAQGTIDQYVPGTTEYMRAEKGSLKTASFDEIKAGDMLVSCFPDYQGEVLIIYHMEEE